MRRLEQLQRQVDGMSSSTGEVEDAFSQVNRMMSRIKMVQPFVALAALENLVDVATKHGHKDATYLRKALLECRSREDDPGFADLVCQLFGSAEDRKVAAVVHGWRKAKRVEGEATLPSAPGVTPAPTPPQSFYPPPFSPYAVPVPFPGYSPPPGNVRGRNPQSRRPGPRAPGGASCYFCREPGHLIATCEKAKAAAAAQGKK